MDSKPKSIRQPSSNQHRQIAPLQYFTGATFMVEKQQLTESEVHSDNAITSAQEQSCKLAVSSWQSFEGANKKEIAERVEMHEIYCSLIGHPIPRLQEQLEKIMRDKAIDSSPSALAEPN